jgi:hypothetical protein
MRFDDRQAALEEIENGEFIDVYGLEAMSTD